MLILFFACSEPPPAAPPVAALPPAAPTRQPREPPKFKTGLCTTDETVRAAFKVKNGKIVSVCQTGTRFIYRFGAPSDVELELDQPRDAWSFGHETLGGDSERHVLSVWNGDTRYAIESLRNEDQFDLAVAVHEGPKRIAHLPGRLDGQLGMDFTGLPPRQSPAPLSQAWTGHWTQQKEASFTIEPHAGGLRLVDGEATWRGTGGMVNTGQASGPLRQDGATLKLDSDGCAITLTLKNDDEAWLEDNLGCGGLNVRFMGTFRRAP